MVAGDVWLLGTEDIGVQRKLHAAVSTAPGGHADLLRHLTRLQHLAKFFDEGSHAALAPVGFLLDWYEHPERGILPFL